MKKSRFSEGQIVGIIREAESSTATVEAVCRKHSISAHTFYRWRNKFGGLEVKDATGLKELERENHRPKKIVADQALDISILKEINSKNGKRTRSQNSGPLCRRGRIVCKEGLCACPSREIGTQLQQ